MATAHRNPAPAVALIAALALLAGCAAPAGDGDGRHTRHAPVDDVRIEPPDRAEGVYGVRITSGLPNGCAEFERIDVEREGNHFTLTVWNTEPSDDDTLCTLVYRQVENTTELGRLEPGTTYTVAVNEDTALQFTPEE